MGIITTSIPELLKQYNHWLCWQSETRNGKPTKVPKNPHTGGNAGSTYPSSWGTFEQALAAQQRYGLDGIGFALARDKVGLVGIDLDDCVTNGQLTPLAAHIVATLDSYTEITPSGAGLRIFALADLPDGRRKDTSQGVEMYDGGRYLTVTGQHWPGTPRTIERRPQQVQAIHRQVFGDPAPTPSPPSPVQPVGIDDQQLLNLALSAKNGNHFALLWNGQWQGNGWASHSEADQGLVNILAFWTGNDAHRIDALFRQSGLMRDKWDRKTGDSTYGQITIDRAITDTKETYSPPVGINVKDIILMADDRPQDATAGPGSWADLEGLLGPIEWDWPGWIARGFQIMVTAYAGEGKSNLILHLAKTYLTGCPWPDGSPFKGQPGAVLWCETESAQSLNFSRAKQWGLPIENILTPLPDPLEDISLDNPDHQAAMIQIGQRPDVKAVIVDSLSGGTSRKAVSSSEMGQVGKFLAGAAKFTGKPVIVTHHLNKPNRNFKPDKIALDRVRDSSAIVQYARLIWAIDAPDAEIEHQKRLYAIKSNLGRFPQPLGFVVTGTGLVFGDAPQPPRKETELERAAKFLRKTLQAGPVPASDITEMAESEGLTERTLKRAKKVVNVVSTKIDGKWHWQKQDPIETIII